MRWEQGRETIADMLRRGKLVLGDKSEAHASAILDGASRHLESTLTVVDRDPAGAYELAYEAACKALVATLVAQGLHPNCRGDHLALYDAVSAQFDPPYGQALKPFIRLRAQRIEIEHGSPSALAMSPRDVLDDLGKVVALINFAGRLIPQLKPYGKPEVPYQRPGPD